MALKQSHCKRGHEFTLDNIRMHGKKRTCRVCALERDAKARVSETRKAWRERNPDYPRINSLKNLYKLTPEALQDRIDKQFGVCLVCRERLDWRTASVDHDHKCCPTVKTCGKCIRGVLCRTCNVGLGAFKDDPRLLEAAKQYLEEL